LGVVCISKKEGEQRKGEEKGREHIGFQSRLHILPGLITGGKGKQGRKKEI